MTKHESTKINRWDQRMKNLKKKLPFIILKVFTIFALNVFEIKKGPQKEALRFLIRKEIKERTEVRKKAYKHHKFVLDQL